MTKPILLERSKQLVHHILPAELAPLSKSKDDYYVIYCCETNSIFSFVYDVNKQ